jgi:beta-glucosidase
MGWEVFPDGLHDGLVRVHRDYAPARIYITENGAAYTDEPGADGRIRDARRITYLRDHLAAAQRAVAAGVPLGGYLTWSLMDNFEWGFGFTKRFGLYAVDFATLERTPRDSASWYRDVIARNGVDDAPSPVNQGGSRAS